MTDTTAPKAPPLIWTLLEGRSMIEFGWFKALESAMKRLPQGDGHPVIVLPGFVASDRSTQPMRRLLGELGYKSYGWGLGRNLKFDAQREQQLNALIDRVYDSHGRKISLIGWSLGGVFARELAKQHADKIRLVISLGSPIANDRRHSNARHLFEAINGSDLPEDIADRYTDLEEAPPVPTTSIYTRSDGIVAWRASLQRPTATEQTENIRVPASHTGLGVNPIVMFAIADRLAQPEGHWEPFDRKGIRRFFFWDHPPS